MPSDGKERDSKLPGHWLTWSFSGTRRAGAVAARFAPRRRSYGTLESITDSDQRSLRPIAASAYEVAVRTGELLADLVVIPGVRVFHGVRRPGPESPLIPHAVSSGRRLILVESVAWPAGRYETSENGCINCDGVYIGQSVRSLTAAVTHWSSALPSGHEVSAMVVVYVAATGRVILPAGSAGDVISWVTGEDAGRAIRQRLLPGARPASRELVAALIAATSARPDGVRSVNGARK